MTKTKNVRKGTNKSRVANALLKGKVVTRKSAATLGVKNLRATISDLRNNGYSKIKTNIVTVKGVKLVKYTM